MSDEFVAATLNLWRMRGGWRKRRDLVLRELERIEPDVLALQEVAPLRRQAHDLARALSKRLPGEYRAFVARKRGWRGLLEGIAVITRLPARSDSRPIGGTRVAQRVRVLLPGGQLVTMFNTHLEAGGDMREQRMQQMDALLRWARGESNPVLLAGDFNAHPASRTLGKVSASGFVSAFSAAHGSEPPWTAPATEHGPDGNVLDYLFADRRLQVLWSDLAFAQPDAAGRYPSDHFGLLARLRVRS